ncbi:hypothetical protein IVB18_41875 [Bradyrhizobium sp. 186]|uniref:hypothetical protein n=1 Tax=Bradyrhizobium sp. 186 TaxID=2782654 RepID=UPI0020007651|nr:hypothetical protein [Bradyrhizobium sp. 186]UPK34537.1 hypothetical protein IVB18_41875 [Bradyrhizobium sp. 186]
MTGALSASTYEGFNASTPWAGHDENRQCRHDRNGDQGRQAFAGSEGSVSEWTGDARADISVAHLMAMSSGLEFNEDEGLVNDAAGIEFLVRDAAPFASEKVLVAAPGTTFHNGSGSSVLSARIWQNAIGAAARAFPQERCQASRVNVTPPSSCFCPWSTPGRHIMLSEEAVSLSRYARFVG